MSAASQEAPVEMAMIADIAAVAPESFDALDTAAGAGACYQRLRQKQADGRWRVSYLRATEYGRLKAVVPLYICRGKTWPHPAYDARTWPLAEHPGDAADPGKCLLVGGCSDARSSLHIRHSAGDCGTLRQVLAEIASYAAEQDRCLVFPYLPAASKTAMITATGDAIAWAALSAEARWQGVSGACWEMSLGSRVRGVLRRDRRLLSEEGPETAVHSWQSVEDEACELIAAHNVRKGGQDHPEFVRLRYSEWLECDGVELVVFRAVAEGVTGMLTALVWKDELELCEIGLAGEDGPRRLAAYLSLIFHLPVQFARSRRLRDIRAGFGAEIPKRARGATFEHLYGGVLDHSRTRRLAGDRVGR